MKLGIYASHRTGAVHLGPGQHALLCGTHIMDITSTMIETVDIASTNHKYFDWDCRLLLLMCFNILISVWLVFCSLFESNANVFFNFEFVAKMLFLHHNHVQNGIWTLIPWVNLSKSHFCIHTPWKWTLIMRFDLDWSGLYQCILVQITMLSYSIILHSHTMKVDFINAVWSGLYQCILVQIIVLSYSTILHLHTMKVDVNNAVWSGVVWFVQYNLVQITMLSYSYVVIMKYQHCQLCPTK